MEILSGDFETSTLIEEFANGEVRRFDVEVNQGDERVRYKKSVIDLPKGQVRIQSSIDGIKWLSVGGAELSICVPSEPNNQLLSFDDPIGRVGYAVGNFEDVDLIIARALGIKDPKIDEIIASSALDFPVKWWVEKLFA